MIASRVRTWGLVAGVCILVGCGGSAPDDRPSTRAGKTGTASAARATAPRGATVAVDRQRVRTDHLRGAFFRPAGQGPGGPAILVLGGSEGRSPRGLARALARRGYPALAVAYFGLPGLPERLCRIPLEYFKRGLRWLRGRSADRGAVLLGISRGSEAALLSAVEYSERVAGTIAAVPSSAVQPGDCKRRAGGYPLRAGAAWTVDGRVIPHLSALSFALAPPIERRFSIPVWRLEAPLLAIGAGADQVWPSAEYARTLFRRASTRARRPPGGVLILPRAGHSAGCFEPDCSGRTALHGRPLGGSRDVNERAQDEAWSAVLGFLESLG